MKMINMKKIKMHWKFKVWFTKYRIKHFGRFMIAYKLWMHEQSGSIIKLGIEFKHENWETDHIGRITYYKKPQMELSIFLIKFRIDFIWSGIV